MLFQLQATLSVLTIRLLESVVQRGPRMMRRIVCLGMTALLLQGCGTDLESVLQFTYPLISGDYAIGYHSPEGRFGIGKSSLTLDGTVEGDILGPNGATYTITGGLSPTMELQIDITGPDGTVDFQWLGG
ncbi:MAG TPA: hypothetical protein DIU15_19715, partial [Deltaproteobacteria bacterium]|nr:hypothetical protein [Deltaproteobacteria bacterium]